MIVKIFVNCPTGTMKLYAANHRTLAASCFSSHDGNIMLATKDFAIKLLEMGLKLPKCPAGFVRYWGRRWLLLASVAGDGSNSGRRRKLTDAQLEQLLDLIMHWRRDGKTGPYRSMKELKMSSQLARDIIAAADCSSDTLRRRLTEYCPGLVYRKLWIKQKLTAQRKQARFDACCELLELPEKDPELVVWLDAKTMYMTISNRKGWVLLGEEDTFETNYPAGKKQPIVLKYYAAVNYRVGKVGLIFYTGTTGMKADRDPNRTYMVSSVLEELALFFFL